MVAPATIPGYLPALGLSFETEALFLLAPPPEPAPPSFLPALGPPPRSEPTP